MICRFCGSDIPDNSEYCQVCGSVLENNVQNNNIQNNSIQNNNIQQNYVQYDNNTGWQNNQQYNNAGCQNNQQYNNVGWNNNQQYNNTGWQNNQQYNNTGWNNNVTYQPVLPMKWFKFIIYFQLFVGALSGLVNAIYYFSGVQYEGVVYEIYKVSPVLKCFSIFIGVLYIAYGIYSVVIRFSLSKYKKNAPMLYYLLYVIMCVLSILTYIDEIIAAVIFYNNNLLEKVVYDNILSTNVVNCFVRVIVTAGFISANVIYFNKRKHLFVN